MTPTRKTVVRLLLTALVAGAALLGVAAPVHATASQGSAAQAAAAAPCGIVRLHRALNVSRGGVDTVYGNWTGTDYSTGVLYPSRFGGFDQLAHFGVNLVPNTRVIFQYNNTFTGEVRYNNPGVSHNSVMRDDNRDYPNNRVGASALLSPGFWHVRVAYFDGCDGQAHGKDIGSVQL